jgi:hypothetical protein
MRLPETVAFAAAVCVSVAYSVPLASQTAKSGTVLLSCSGPAAMAARNIAKREKLTLGSDPKACLALASMYGGSSKQLIAAAPSAACAPKKAIQVYEKSIAGPWGNLLEKPVCGNSVSFGPNNPWGAIMITIDGRHYDQRGQYYTLAKY